MRLSREARTTDDQRRLRELLNLARMLKRAVADTDLRVVS